MQHLTQGKYGGGSSTNPTNHSRQLQDSLAAEPESESPGSFDGLALNSTLNQPGHWDYFLAYRQPGDGGQVKSLCLMLQERGKTVWCEGEMCDRSTAAMEEGVRHSAHFLLFLSGGDAEGSSKFESCLDQPSVQQVVRWAKQFGKPTTTVFEADDQQPGFFDYGKAWEKYGGQEWEFLLNIDSVTFRRDTHEAKAMLGRILDKSRGGRRVGPVLNQPGHWDYFLAHGQAAAGDQVKSLCLMLQERGKTVWYDNEMGDRSTAAMEEGVRHSTHFLLFLSGDPELVHGTDTRAAAAGGDAGWRVNVCNRCCCRRGDGGGAPTSHLSDGLVVEDGGDGHDQGGRGDNRGDGGARGGCCRPREADEATQAWLDEEAPKGWRTRGGGTRTPTRGPATGGGTRRKCSLAAEAAAGPRRSRPTASRRAGRRRRRRPGCCSGTGCSRRSTLQSSAPTGPSWTAGSGASAGRWRPARRCTS
eukprot:SAG22_NODE_1002_length_6052_cov_3.257558_6_plen_472_part_00